jgi:hypothetical protein
MQGLFSRARRGPARRDAGGLRVLLWVVVLPLACSDSVVVASKGSTTGTASGTSSAGAAVSGTSSAGGAAMSATVGTASGIGGAGGSLPVCDVAVTVGSGLGGGAGAGGGDLCDGSGGSCIKVTTLHPPLLDAGPGTLYCPFSGVDGGPDQYCVPGPQHCCETPEGSTPTQCQPIATACMTGTGYVDWQCEDPVADCSAGAPVCCAPGASIGLGCPGCGNFAHQMNGTTCVPTGACAGIILCTSNAECPAGLPTCTPFEKAGNQVGGCM